MLPQTKVNEEEVLHKKFRAKCRFKALVRQVKNNLYWLMGEFTAYEGVDDVKRRVAQAVRKKTKREQLLTMTDKALLNKPAEERTEQERKYIYRIIGGLKCFKKYPDHVKKKLAAVTYYRYYGPGRVIVRQNHEAHALYFIVTGEVTISLMIYDDLLQQHMSVDVGQMSAGGMFGEVSLLHNIPRTATCTTSGHCEFLALMKEDFKNVLQASLQKQWAEVNRAMSSFSYFDGLDEVARREGCIVAKLKSFKPNETILGDGAGVPNYVYFILAGRCQMIESLQIIVTRGQRGHSYTLYDPYVQEESEQDIDKKYFTAYQQTSKTAEHDHTDSKSDVQKTSPTIRTSKCTSMLKETSFVSENETKASTAAQKHVSITTSAPGRVSITSSRKSDKTVSNNSVTVKSIKTKEKTRNLLNESSNNFEHRTHRSSSLKSEDLHSRNLQTYFMQVCILNPGSVFGFGENMRDRRIVALTRVNCLLLPQMWLLQRNAANIWSRIQHYLKRKIPTKMQLFEEFKCQRRWQAYRDRVVAEVVAQTKTVNWTTKHDVPYSIRIEEVLEI